MRASLDSCTLSSSGRAEPDGNRVYRGRRRRDQDQRPRLLIIYRPKRNNSEQASKAGLDLKQGCCRQLHVNDFLGKLNLHR